MVLRSMSKSGLRTLSVVLSLVIVSACAAGTENANGPSDSETQTDTENITLSIGTGQTGSALNAVGAGLASVVSSNSSVQMDVKPFSGITAYGSLLNKGEDVFLAAVTGPELTWSYRGEQNYKRLENLRLLVAGNYIVSTGIVVRDESGIESVADLKGKRVGSYDSTPIGNQVVEATLTANGLTWDDVTPVPVSGGSAGIKAIQDDRIEGAYSYAPEAPLVQKVNNAVGLKAIDAVDNTTPDQIDNIPQNVVEEFTSRVPGSRLTVAQPVGFIEDETIAVEFPIAIGVSSSVSDDAVYQIMKTLWKNYKKLHPIHAWFETWNPEQMFDESPTVPYHPGAIQFFKDKGLWTDELEQIQQDLLQLADS